MNLNNTEREAFTDDLYQDLAFEFWHSNKFNPRPLTFVKTWPWAFKIRNETQALSHILQIYRLALFGLSVLSIMKQRILFLLYFHLSYSPLFVVETVYNIANRNRLGSQKEPKITWWASTINSLAVGWVQGFTKVTVIVMSKGRTSLASYLWVAHYFLRA